MFLDVFSAAFGTIGGEGRGVIALEIPLAVICAPAANGRSTPMGE
jgi:hypothetical protein